MEQKYSMDDMFCGSATVGERGQIVIPSDARKRMNISPGDKLLVMAHPVNEGLLLCKIDAMKEFFTTILEDLKKIEDVNKVVTEAGSVPEPE